MTSRLTIGQAKRLRNDFECWQQDYDPKDDKEQYDMFGRGMVAMDMLIAGMYQEPVAYTDERNLGYIDRGRETAYLWGKQNSEASDVALYRHAQQPVVDADDNFYSWFGREWQENYQHNQYTTAAKQMLGVMAESAWKAGHRAAMLQAAPVCTCPSGDGSLRWPCPVHPGNSPAIPGWIPVSQRMPGSQEWVIVFAKWANQQVLCWDDVQNRWTDFEDQSYYADMFSHWMPLPAAPQEFK